MNRKRWVAAALVAPRWLESGCCVQPTPLTKSSASRRRRTGSREPSLPTSVPATAGTPALPRNYSAARAKSSPPKLTKKTCQTEIGSDEAGPHQCDRGGEQRRRQESLHTGQR